ncbi:dihydrodipicolinate synthase family protein [Kibdelosporangium aridum]|uniref:Dihydrodipicolinate synthase family protein n=1 Tax=Kibdelosporangium aridum TaxID=2030 RepID=A0A428Z7W2_KIBAR|nr:dihydrodipicolinate synthase family protein [Kibdelosporangium aridum]RSM83883.1 dihydrodipicolinate synthase family protein [Kibdelosporangium aridum]
MIIDLPSGPYEVVSSGGYSPGPAPVSRRLFAAAHVVADPLGDNTPGSPAVVDWDATLAYRNHLWSHGFGVAEAMDTAQRGMGLDWTATQELIRRTGANAAGPFACGAGTDQLGPGTHSVDAVIQAYLEQIAVIEETGGQVILMASRALAAAAAGPDDYHRVYGHLLSQTSKPVILHWLGPMFDPLLEGYWGSPDLDVATDVFVEIIKSHASAVDGVKISLLDASREVSMRRRLPAGVRCYTGDDFNYPSLILGDSDGYSDALLGIFDAIAPAAAAAVRALDASDVDSYNSIFAPTVPLSRHIFGTPTYYYKTGIVFLAWLAGHQSHFKMVGGLESARSVPHLVTLFKLADAAGLLPDPDLAVHRMRAFLEVST